MAAGAVALAAALAVSACSATASNSSATASNSTAKLSLSVEDYHTNEPLKSAMEGVYETCAASIGVSVNYSHVPGNNLIAKVLQQASSKTMPDVLMLDNPDVARIAATGGLTPLSDYGISTEGVTPSVIEAGTYEGKLYGLAPTVNTLGIFYNKDMFAEAGISSPPTTWDELRADAKKLTTADHAGFALGAYPDEGDAWSFLPFMWSNGGDETDLTGAATVQALQFLVDLLGDKSMPVSVVNWQQGDVATQFANGKVAMMINGPWNIAGFEASKLNWGTASVPTRVAGQTVQSPLGGEAYTVPNTGDSAKMNAAGKLVACINTSENELTISKLTGNIPSITTAAQTVGSEDANVEPFVGLVATARARTAKLGVEWPAAAKAIYTAEGLAFTGKASASDALAQALKQ